MLIKNNGEEFKTNFGGVEYTIPNGSFETRDEKLGHYIVSKGKKWGYDINVVSEDEKIEIKPIEPIVQDIKEEEVLKEDVKEEEILEEKEDSIEDEL